MMQFKDIDQHLISVLSDFCICMAHFIWKVLHDLIHFLLSLCTVIGRKPAALHTHEDIQPVNENLGRLLGPQLHASILEKCRREVCKFRFSETPITGKEHVHWVSDMGIAVIEQVKIALDVPNTRRCVIFAKPVPGEGLEMNC